MSAIESRVSLILEDLSKRAVAEIIKLFDGTFAAFIEELNKKQSDIDRLTKNLKAFNKNANQVDVNTTGQTLGKLPAPQHGEPLVTVQGSNFQHDYSTQVVQWDSPEKHQFIFEGTIEADVDEAHLVVQIDEQPPEEDTAAVGLFSEAPVDLSRSESEEEEEEDDDDDDEEEEEDVLELESDVSGSSQRQTSGAPRKKGKVRARPKTYKKRTNNVIYINKRCKDCYRYFSRPTDLARHRFLVHNQKEMPVCNVCGAAFLSMSALTVHMRIHTGERPFDCDICGKSFTCKSSLLSHTTVHNLKCSACGSREDQPLEDDPSRRRRISTRPCAKCGKTKYNL